MFVIKKLARKKNIFSMSDPFHLSLPYICRQITRQQLGYARGKHQQISASTHARCPILDTSVRTLWTLELVH